MNFSYIFLFSSAIFAVNGKPVDDNDTDDINGKIVGGGPVTIEEYPHQVSMQFYGSHMCGGSIISVRTILTAAHCTDGKSASSLTVRAGSTYRREGGEVVQVARISQHPGYNARTILNDVSLLILEKALTVGKIIDLATQIPPAGSKVFVTGWGYLYENGPLPNQLQGVELEIVSQENCSKAYSPATISDDMFCAGFPNGGKDACQGDSGGPLVAGGQLVGVVSWGYGCARPQYPGVFANVAQHRNFILSNMV